MEDIKLKEIAPEHIGSGTKARAFQAPPISAVLKYIGTTLTK